MYPCPGGCGRSNDTGSWCGTCSWVAGLGGFTPESLAEMRAQPWPFNWHPPAKAWFQCGANQ